MLKKINDFLAGIPMTIVGGVFLAVSLALSLTDHKAPIDPAWVAVIICGIPLLYLSVWRIIHNHGISKISSALLISIAMIAAIAIGDLFAAGEVAFIMSIGAILEDKTTERAKKGLKELISLTPRQGRRIVNGKEEMIAAEEIKMEDVLRVLPGETIPVDGDIIEGTTSVDQSIMTGNLCRLTRLWGTVSSAAQSTVSEQSRFGLRNWGRTALCRSSSAWWRRRRTKRHPWPASRIKRQAGLCRWRC